jgi:hypothetical protein
VFPLTQATLIKNEFMTLICVCVIFEQVLQKECVQCRNYNYIIVKKNREFWLTCIYLCCWCFHLGVYFNVCLFAYLFRLYSLFVFIYCLCYVTVLYHFFFESRSCSKTRLSYFVCLLIDCIRCILENSS